MTEISQVGEANFESEVLKSSTPVLVDFTAVWCSPCKMLDPIVKQLAQEWQNRVKVVKLDVDDNSHLAMEYQVMGVPTLMLFVGGKAVQRLTGFQPKDKISAKLTPHL
jgi:thioredoxin 1